MGFFDNLAKNAALWGAVEASKDAKGKPDPYKAAGIAAGMGNIIGPVDLDVWFMGKRK